MWQLCFGSLKLTAATFPFKTCCLGESLKLSWSHVFEGEKELFLPLRTDEVLYVGSCSHAQKHNECGGPNVDDICKKWHMAAGKRLKMTSRMLIHKHLLGASASFRQQGKGCLALAAAESLRPLPSNNCTTAALWVAAQGPWLFWGCLWIFHRRFSFPPPRPLFRCKIIARRKCSEL